MCAMNDECPGRFQIAMGLFLDHNAVHPDIALGLKEATAESWHPLATITNKSEGNE